MLLCLMGATVQVAHDHLVLLQAQHPSWITQHPSVCHNALLTKRGGMATVLNGVFMAGECLAGQDLGTRRQPLSFTGKAWGREGILPDCPAFRSSGLY